MTNGDVLRWYLVTLLIDMNMKEKEIIETINDISNVDDDSLKQLIKHIQKRGYSPCSIECIVHMITEEQV